ncbi:hypothetical protein [Streptomyces sp. NPDC003832]
MGTHSADTSKLREALYWAVAHRRKLAAAVVVALPLVARLVPGFPDDVIADALRAYLGA